MRKKVLMLAAKANMIQQFNHQNIKILQNLGYEVHVATNMVDFGSMSKDENDKLKKWMKDNKIISHQVDFERRMGTLKSNLYSLKQLTKLFNDNNFEFVHLHSPLGSILGRIVAKIHNIPTIYTAHGFHFFKGGPKSRWILFYPIEWFFSFFTDVLITINGEDYAFAKRHMHAKKTIKINGIGIDVDRSFSITSEEKYEARKKVRKELGIPNSAFLISSVGELSKRKNHQVVLEALKKFELDELKNVFYIIAGTGDNGPMLTKMAASFRFDQHFKLLGYRSDIDQINYASDVSVFPSLQEGLGVSGLEAVADGTYLIGNDIRGIKDYVFDSTIGETFDARNPTSLANIFKRIMSRKCFDKPHNQYLNDFDYKKINNEMKKVYESIKKKSVK